MGIFLSIRKVLLLIVLLSVLQDVRCNNDDSKREGKRQNNLCGKLNTAGCK